MGRWAWNPSSLESYVLGGADLRAPYRRDIKIIGGAQGRFM